MSTLMPVEKQRQDLGGILIDGVLNAVKVFHPEVPCAQLFQMYWRVFVFMLVIGQLTLAVPEVEDLNWSWTEYVRRRFRFRTSDGFLTASVVILEAGHNMMYDRLLSATLSMLSAAARTNCACCIRVPLQAGVVLFIRYLYSLIALAGCSVVFVHERVSNRVSMRNTTAVGSATCFVLNTQWINNSYLPFAQPVAHALR
ncbi:hypothetical protein BC629DRAFT_11356 [Irpex lacteus]|nr:hypothetical protein BC629DRAFT_11356 [Irpex lacteus]